MKVSVLVFCLVAAVHARPDVSHLKTQNYSPPATSYGVPVNPTFPSQNDRTYYKVTAQQTQQNQQNIIPSGSYLPATGPSSSVIKTHAGVGFENHGATANEISQAPVADLKVPLDSRGSFNPQIADGSSQFGVTSQVTGGSASFGGGSSQFGSGAPKTSGSFQIGSVSPQFAGGSSQFDSGSSQFGSGSTQFGGGSSQIGGGSAQFGGGSSQFGSGSTQFRGGYSQIGGGSAQFGGGSSQYDSFGTQEVKHQKHVYYFAAPDEHEEPRPRITIPAYPAEKHTKIIFIRAPTYAAPLPPLIAPQPQHETKTIVYVLVRKPEDIGPIDIPQPIPTQPSKPEVYFIKYNSKEEAEQAISGSLSGTASQGSISVNSLSDSDAFVGTLSSGSRGGSVDYNAIRAGFDNQVNSGNAGVSSGGVSSSYEGSSSTLSYPGAVSSVSSTEAPVVVNVGSYSGESSSIQSSQGPVGTIGVSGPDASSGFVNSAVTSQTSGTQFAPAGVVSVSLPDTSIRSGFINSAVTSQTSGTQFGPAGASGPY